MEVTATYGLLFAPGIIERGDEPPMRALKIAGIVVGALVGLIVIGVAAILLIVDPNDYRDDIAQLVQEKTGRPLDIRGKLDLKIFPWIALNIHDVTLGNPPAYGKEPFLTVQTASVGVKLMPLLRKQVQVSRVSVEGLSVTLVSRGEEDNNWKDLGESKETETPPSTGPAPQVSIEGVDVSKSMLVYRDEAAKKVSRLSGLEVHTGAVGGSDPVKAEIKFTYDEGSAPTVAQLEAKAQVAMLDDGKRLQVQDLDAKGTWFGSAPEKGAKPSDPLAFAVTSPALAIAMEAETLAPTTLAIKVGDLPVQVTAKGEKLFGDYIIDGTLAIEKTSARKLMQSFGIEPPVTSDANALSAFALKSGYRVTTKTAALSALDLTLDDTRIRGSAGIEDLDAMAMRFDLDVDAINLDRYMAPEEKKDEKGAQAAKAADGGKQAAASGAAAPPPTDLPLDLIRDLNLAGQLRVGKATVENLPFTDVRLPIDVRNSRAHLGPTQAKFLGGAYNGDIVLDAKPARAVLTLNEHAKGIDIGALMKAGFETDRVVGRGDANAALTATGNTDAALFKTLSGKIDFNVKDGAVNGMDIWYEIRRAVALFKRQAVPERAAGVPKTAFEALSGSAVLTNGVLRNEDLLADLTYLKAKGKGTLALDTQAIDYRIVTEVYKLPADASATGLADLKAAEIPVTITGTLADMKVRPDVEGYLKARFKKEVDQKVDEKKEELKKKLGDKLKGILGH
jgi:AsmA protein